MATIIGAEWLQVLDNYVQEIGDAVTEADAIAAEELYQQTVSRARRTPGWDMLADNIEVWSSDGSLVIGVRDQDLTSQATALEFGQQHEAPSPLFRTLTSEAQVAGEARDTALRNRLPERF